MLDYVILGFLMKTDLSGYDIKQFMGYSIANFYDASFGSIYPSLKRMEDRGLISPREVLEGGKYKKIYTIHESGRTEFLKWLEQPIELPRARHEHLIRIFFYGFLPQDKVKSLVFRFIQDIEAEMGHLRDIENRFKNHADLFEMATLRYGKDFYGFLLEWCKEFLKKAKSESGGEN